MLEAVKREVKEETGLEIREKDMRRLPSIYCEEIQQKDGKKLFVYIPYYVKNFSGRIQTGDENEPFWIEISKLKSLNLLPNVYEIIQEALDNFT